MVDTGFIISYFRKRGASSTSNGIIESSYTKFLLVNDIAAVKLAFLR